MVKLPLTPIGLAFALLGLVACADMNEPAMSKSKTIEIAGQSFTFAAPDGFCLDTPTFQMRRGVLDADTVFANIDASNCQASTDGFAPAPLTHIITLSASPSDAKLEQTIGALKAHAGETWVPRQEGYRAERRVSGYAAVDYASEMNGFLTLIRVTSLRSDANIQNDDILNQTVATLKYSNYGHNQITRP